MFLIDFQTDEFPSITLGNVQFFFMVIGIGIASGVVLVLYEKYVQQAVVKTVEKQEC